MDTKKAKKAIQAVAKRHGISEEEVIREIEAALAAGGKAKEKTGMSAYDWVTILSAKVKHPD